jgi:NTP pyrophosphatase (non-canonical NTP hydrolase)
MATNKPDYQALTTIAAEMHGIAADHGFHDGDTTPEIASGTERMCIAIVNIHGEASELLEAVREGALHKQCNKPIPLTKAEEELADIVIRAMDTAHAIGVDLGRAVELKAAYNRNREFMHGKKA